MRQPSTWLGCRWLVGRLPSHPTSPQPHSSRLVWAALLIATTCHVPPSQAMGSQPPSTEHSHEKPATPSTGPRFPFRKPPPEAAHLESTLYQLTQAEDAAAFANAHGIALVENRVRVIIELQEGHDFVAGPQMVVESKYRNLVQTLVPLGQLVPLSQQHSVRFVGLPQEPVADDE